MLPFFDVTCPCGRTLRARSEQGGAMIRCWDCGGEVPVPYPRLRKGRLARALCDAARLTLRSDVVNRVAIAAAVMTVVLLVPYAGPWLALGLLAAGVWYYQDLVANTGRAGTTEERPAGLPEPGAWTLPVASLTLDAAPGPASDSDAHPERATSPRAVAARIVLAVVAAFGLVAPVLIHNAGDIRPSSLSIPGTHAWMVATFLAGWLAMPLILFLTRARDRRGPLTPQLATSALARHPIASLSALSLAPVGLIVVETVLVLFTSQQGILPLFVVDLFPTPEVKFTTTGWVWQFDYDNHLIDKEFDDGTSGFLPIYRAGLEQGFTLSGAVPTSLANWDRSEIPAENFNFYRKPYLALRIVLTFCITLALGLIFSVQARWLALIAALDAHRPPNPRAALADNPTATASV